MTSTHSLLEALTARVREDDSYFMTEVWVPMGSRRYRLDALVLQKRPHPRLGHLRVAYELKSSRRDLRRELRAPDKTAAMFEHAHEAYFVVLPGLLRPKDELPEELGVLELRKGGRLVKVRPAKRRRLPDLDPYAFFDALEVALA